MSVESFLRSPSGRAMGHVPGPYPADAAPVRPLIGALRPGTLQPVDHSHYVDRIRDQNPVMACVGAARARVLHCCAQRQAFGGPNPGAVPYPSELGIYWLARAEMLERPTDEVVDEGSTPAAADLALSRDVGIPLERDWPFESARVNTPLPAEVLARACPYKMTEYRVVDSSGQQRVDDVCQVLSQLGPLTAAIPVDEQYDGCISDRTVRAAGDRISGMHDVVIAGWRIQRGSSWRREFLNPGSWGVGFGFGGWTWLDEDVLADERCTALVVPRVVLSWVPPRPAKE